MVGVIRLRDGAWHIKAEPHALTMLRRVFPRVKVDRDDPLWVKIQDTDEVCRLLSWFLDLFPLELDARAKTRLYKGRRAHLEAQQYVASVLEGGGEPRHFALAIPLRDYQKVPPDLALRLGGVLCGDDLGLGKTAEGIATLADPAMRPALVVTMTHLQTQWQREIERFLPGARVHILRTKAPYALGTPAPDVLVTNYAKIDGWADVLAPKIRGLIFDECQELRHDGTKKYEAALQLAAHAKVRMGLSATPVYNYGGEMFNVMNCIRPGVLGSKDEFITAWGTKADDKGRIRVRDPRAFGDYLRREGLMIRRTRAEVGRELPGLFRTLQPIDCEGGATVLRSASRSLAEYARTLLQQSSTPFQRLQAAQQLDSILRQTTGLMKAPGVADFVELLLDSEEKIVLFGWHHNVYQIWRERLATYGVAMYTGRESPREKEAALNSFAATSQGAARVLVMSLRAGAGLDGLQHFCRTVVHGELDWSPKAHDQSDGRVHRDGQKDPVSSYVCATDEGSDPIVLDVNQMKMGQIEGVVNCRPDAVLDYQIDPDKSRLLAEAVLEKLGARAGVAR